VRANRRVWPAVVVAASVAGAALVQPAAASAARLASAQVRVNQVGYRAYAPKVAYAMLPRKVASVRFEVVTPYGVAYRGTSTDDTGAWNANYQAVYRLSFSGLHLPAQYQVKVVSPVQAASPWFIVGDGSQLYQELVTNSLGAAGLG
jgi:Cellulase N-terminal ig-like domain